MRLPHANGVVDASCAAAWYGLVTFQQISRDSRCSELMPRRLVCPVGNWRDVAFTVPPKKRVKHVWTYWGAVSGQLRPALAAQLGTSRWPICAALCFAAHKALSRY